MASVIQVTSVNYPESDGRPMGETDEHRDEMVREIELLRRFFEDRDTYVSGNLLLYYEQGNPKKFVVPDVFVVKDVEPKKRRIYKLWIERKAPDVVLEVTSRKTKKKDTVAKPALYARLGVKEYFLFDPTQDYLDPPLQGHRLVGEDYEQIEPDARGAIVSDELGLRLQVERGQLMFYRLDTGQRLLTAEEAWRAEAESRRAAEAEVARLRAELRRRDDS
ncbi:MAG: Uma2 family endonuclease [Planctomycetes bacterium]|nr:Uma2 family endonuclease [Planctomycetota bacterium]MBL7042236.1 Uma2 family endonuclease [Pirellulaceae bacterium]